MSLRIRKEVQALPRRAAASERLTRGANRAAIHVVAGAVVGGDGRVLIAQRPPGKHLAGAWEFPGGKLEPGETRAAGLARELREELGIDIHQPRPLIRVRHAYADGEVLIDAWVVTRYDGKPRSLDGQALRWCRPEELASAGLLPADRPIVRALRLPPRLTQASTDALPRGGSRACIAGCCGARSAAPRPIARGRVRDAGRGRGSRSRRSGFRRDAPRHGGGRSRASVRGDLHTGLHPGAHRGMCVRPGRQRSERDRALICVIDHTVAGRAVGVSRHSETCARQRKT